MGDPADQNDLAAVTALQDQFAIDAKSSRAFATPDYKPSFDATRNAVLELGKHLGSFDHAFGSKEEVDPPTASTTSPRRRTKMGR